MRDCDKTMTKKADKNSMNSMACDEKSNIGDVIEPSSGASVNLWSSTFLNPPESRIFTDVRI
jgi:hypothetical protein